MGWVKEDLFIKKKLELIINSSKLESLKETLQDCQSRAIMATENLYL